MHSRCALSFELLLQPRPHRRIGSGELKVVHNGPDIKGGSADHDRNGEASPTVLDRTSSKLLEFGDRRSFADIQEIDHVMTDFRALSLGRLGRANIHASIDKHRIRIDNLGPAPVCGVALDQPGSQTRLAGSSRAHEHYGHSHSFAQTAARSWLGGVHPHAPGVQRKLVYFPREVATSMGIFDKAKDALSGQGDKVDAGVEKAGDMVDERTEGKYAEKVDEGQDMARNKLSDMTTDQPEPPAGAPPA
jgi:hypothetical protein